MSFRRPKCQICGSQRWHKEPRTGLITCIEGHILQNYRAEANDTTDLGSHLVKKRSLRVERRARCTGHFIETYHGERARYLYFQCLQLLFRKQSICHDLWALHLSLIPSPPVPEHLDLSDRRSAGQNSDIEEFESDEDSGESEIYIDIPLPDQGPSQEPLVESGQRHQSRRLKLDIGGPIHNVALLILGCWWLRIPVMALDIIRLIEQRRLPYLDPLRDLPKRMAERLSKYVRSMITPRWAPHATDMHALALRMAKLLRTDHNISIPEQNFSPLLWRLSRLFHAPAVVYERSRVLANELDITLTLSHAPNLSLESLFSYNDFRYEGDSEAPELTLAAVIIIAFKLHFLRKSMNRSPLINELCCHVKEFEGVESTSTIPSAEKVYGRHFSHTTLEMDVSEIDRYLEFNMSIFGTESDELESIENMFRIQEGIPFYEGLIATREDEAEPRGIEGGICAAWGRIMVESAARITGWPGADVERSVLRIERRLGKVQIKKDSELPVE